MPEPRHQSALIALGEIRSELQAEKQTLQGERDELLTRWETTRDRLDAINDAIQALIADGGVLP